MNDHSPELPFWIEALQYLRPDQINVLSHLAESGEQFEQMIEEAVWEKLEADGLLDLYRQAHGLPEDWPFDETWQDDDDQTEREP